mmetsp:Transcript_93366/g.246831  ORF Transcript_93366/g.246831 Transcript_93366/m.246831 type:complete len:228 (+) Transcript_93366:88-771(+)
MATYDCSPVASVRRTPKRLFSSGCARIDCTNSWLLRLDPPFGSASSSCTEPFTSAPRAAEAGDRGARCRGAWSLMTPRKSTTPNFLPLTDIRCMWDSSVAAVIKCCPLAVYVERRYLSRCSGSRSGKRSGHWCHDCVSNCDSRVSTPLHRMCLSSGENVHITFWPPVTSVFTGLSCRMGRRRSQTLQVWSNDDVANTCGLVLQKRLMLMKCSCTLLAFTKTLPVCTS